MYAAYFQLGQAPRSLVLIVSLWLFLGVNSILLACSCAPLPLGESVTDSDLVFLGSVRSATAFYSPAGIGFTRIKVDTILVKKGLLEKIPSELLTTNWGGHCGEPTRVPEYYWFFTDAKGQFNQCSGTTLMGAPYVRPWLAESLRAKIGYERRVVEEQMRNQENEEARDPSGSFDSEQRPN